MSEHNATLGVAPGAAKLSQKERRRPGRMDRVSNELIPLLRSSGALNLADDADALGPITLTFDADETDDLRGMKGVMLGAAVGLAFWLGAFGVVRYMLGG